MKSKTTRHGLKRMTALLLAVVLCVGMVPTAFAAQQDSYHDPAENWQEANNRTNELDANATVTHETFNCKVCKQQTSFIVFRTPEYTRDGQTAMSRNVKYSDGTFVDGSGKGSILDGVPGQDAYYTAYHWTKAVCETCGSINTNMAKTDYGYLKNVYWLYDCANNFFEELPETQTIEQADSEYHRVITTSGEYCGFCYGTFKEENSTLERHHMENAIRPELAHDRFVEMDTCADCGYAETSYTAAKAVIADYFGVVDGTFQMLSDEQIDCSILAAIGGAIKWIFAPLGWGNWQAVVASITGLVAKENIVGTLGILYGGGGADVYTAIADAFNGVQGYSFLIFNLLCAPCFAAIGAIRREMNNAKWTWFAIGYQCGFAYVIALIVNQIGAMFMGNGNIFGLIVAILLIAAIVYMLFRKNKYDNNTLTVTAKKAKSKATK